MTWSQNNDDDDGKEENKLIQQAYISLTSTILVYHQYFSPFNLIVFNC